MALFCILSRDPYSHLLECLPGRLERQQMRAAGALCFLLPPSCPAPQAMDSWHIAAHSSDQTFIFVVRAVWVFFSEQWDFLSNEKKKILSATTAYHHFLEPSPACLWAQHLLLDSGHFVSQRILQNHWQESPEELFLFAEGLVFKGVKGIATK